MPIIIITLIAHLLFTALNVYWIIPWTDNIIHLCMGFGLVLLFIKNMKWGVIMSLFALAALAIGWEYVERIRDDAVSDIIYGMIGGIIGVLWIKK
jgi:hydrogenase/urease accessory protein HupE